MAFTTETLPSAVANCINNTPTTPKILLNNINQIFLSSFTVSEEHFLFLNHEQISARTEGVNKRAKPNNPDSPLVQTKPETKP